MSKFPERLKTLRYEKGLSQKELAKLSGVHEDTIANWEKGKNKPTMQKLTRIAVCLGVTTDYLEGYTNTKWDPSMFMYKDLDEHTTPQERYADLIEE